MSAWIIGFVSTLLAGLLLLILAAETDPYFLVSYVLIYLNLMCVLFGFMLNRLRNKTFDILDPLVYVQITFAFLFCFKTIGVINQDNVHLDMSSANDVSAMNLALLYALIWLIICYLGYCSQASDSIFMKISKLPSMSRRKVKIWAPIILLIGIAAWAVKVYISGGIESIISKPNEALLGFYPLNLTIGFINFCFFLSMAAGLKYSDRLLMKYAFFSGLFSFVKAFSSFSKGQFFNFVMGPLIIYYFARGTRPRMRSLFALAAVGLCVFAFFEGFRNLSGGPLEAVSDPLLSVLNKVVSVSPEDFLLSGLSAITKKREGIEAFAIIVRDTESLSFLETLRNLTIMFIPRFLWVDKPIISEGVLFGRQYLNETGITAYTMTIPGSAYRNLYFPGIVISAFLIGVLLRALYRYLKTCKNKESAGFLYAFIFPALGYFMEVGILDLISGIIPLVVLGLFFIYLVRERPRDLTVSR